MTNNANILENAMANFEITARMLKGDIGSELLEKINHPRERIEIFVSPQFADVHVLELLLFVIARHLGSARAASDDADGDVGRC